MIRDYVSVDDYFLSDFGLVRLDKETAENLRKVPVRKSGGYDARYASAKKAAAWMRQANAKATDAYCSGEQFGPDCNLPLEPFRL